MFHIIMRKQSHTRVIQVPIDSGLLSHIDETAGLVSENRAEFIREACRQRLRALETKELESRYAQGYEKSPEDPAMARTNAKLLARILPREKW